MKIISKQLIVLLLFFILTFGSTIYFTFWGLTSALELLSQKNVLLLAFKIKTTIKDASKELQLSTQWSQSNKNQVRAYLLTTLKEYDEIAELVFLNEKQGVLFSLYSDPPPKLVNLNLTNRNTEDQIKIAKPGNSDYFLATWNFDSILCAMLVNPTMTVSGVLHNLSLRFYIVGFSGVIGVIVLSLIWSRVLHTPIKEIEKAMVYLDKRKYGFRLRKKKNSEFNRVFDKVNLALQRLEQLDSVQRNAVQQKNALLREMKTISRFMDMMAHEVKNPLHALVINLDVLKTKIEKGKSKEDVLKHSSILEHEIEHLQEVIQGFLNYVRPGVPRRERTQVNTLLKDVCEMVAPEAQKSKIRVESRLGRKLSDVLIDRGQFQQAMHNLLINAIHATPAGGKVNIRSWAKRKNVLVSIKDTGTGISKEQMQQIFDLYFTTKKNGTGLGLPISKRIIEANGGQMQLQSKLDRGTTVTISLQSV